MKQLGIRKILVSLLCLIAAVSLIGTACAPKPTPSPTPSPSPSPSPAPSEEPIKIGMLLPFTGPASPWSAPHTEAAARLCLDQAGWEVAGRPIELFIEDDAGDPEKSLERAKKLVETDKVDVLLGVLFGASVIAVSNYASQADICYCTYIQQSGAMLQSDPNYSLTPFGTLAGTNVPLGHYAYDVLGYRTAATITQDFVAGNEYIGGFEEGFEERGGEIIQQQRVPLGTVDFAPYLTQVADADCVAFWMAGTMNIMLGQYYEFGIDKPLLACASFSLEEEPMKEMGDTPLGIIGIAHANEYVSGIPENDAFVKEIKERGFLPIQYGYAIYAAVSTFLEAVEATNGDTTASTLDAAWVKVKSNTPAGPISYDEDGCGIGNLYIYEWAKKDSDYYWKVLQEYEGILMRSKRFDY